MLFGSHSSAVWGNNGSAGRCRWSTALSRQKDEDTHCSSVKALELLCLHFYNLFRPDGELPLDGLWSLWIVERVTVFTPDWQDRGVPPRKTYLQQVKADATLFGFFMMFPVHSMIWETGARNRHGMNKCPSPPWIVVYIPAAHMPWIERKPRKAVMGWMTGIHQAGPWVLVLSVGELAAGHVFSELPNDWYSSLLSEVIDRMQWHSLSIPLQSTWSVYPQWLQVTKTTQHSWVGTSSIQHPPV